jgi:hypothetical protein
MFKVMQTAPANVDTCAIFDASALLYRPALRAAVVQEQKALLATRLAMARWTSGNTIAFPDDNEDAPPVRAAFYAREQENFFAWIERGGVWAADAEPANADAASSSDAQ